MEAENLIIIKHITSFRNKEKSEQKLKNKPPQERINSKFLDIVRNWILQKQTRKNKEKL